MAAAPPRPAPAPLQRRDAVALWTLDRLCFPVEDAFSLGTFRRLLQDGRQLGFRFDEPRAPSPLAFIIALREGAAADIVTLDVHPEHRRRGLGRALLRHLHAVLRSAATREVTLQVAEDNGGAQRLYAAEGYAAVGVARGYYGGGRDAVLMRLELDR